MGSTLFLVGDMEQNTHIMDYLRDIEYDILPIKDCKEAYATTSQVMPDLIIITNIKEIEHVPTLAKLKERRETACLPILAVINHEDSAAKIDAIKAGINDFLYNPLDYEELRLKLHNYSIIAEHRHSVLSENEMLKREIAIKTTEMRMNILNIKEAYADVITKLSSAAEYKDPETGEHISRVAYYCKELADGLGMDSDFKEQIFFSAPMHDIGKIGIPDNVLLKRGPLDNDEWTIMRTHTNIGHDILSNPKDVTLAMAQDIALHHHEKFDGSGYPDNIKGYDIPLAARIMSIADVYDALRSDRPYKAGFSHQKSVDILMHGDDRLKPSHFDPQVLEIFRQRSGIFRDIYDAKGDELGKK